MDAKVKVYAIAADGSREKVDFQWTEDSQQLEEMKRRNSKFKNMYNR